LVGFLLRVRHEDGALGLDEMTKLKAQAGGAMSEIDRLLATA